MPAFLPGDYNLSGFPIPGLSGSSGVPIWPGGLEEEGGTAEHGPSDSPDTLYLSHRVPPLAKKRVLRVRVSREHGETSSLLHPGFLTLSTAALMQTESA